jgi:hypothetical protein
VLADHPDAAINSQRRSCVSECHCFGQGSTKCACLIRQSDIQTGNACISYQLFGFVHNTRFNYILALRSSGLWTCIWPLWSDLWSHWPLVMTWPLIMSVMISRGMRHDNMTWPAMSRYNIQHAMSCCFTIHMLCHNISCRYNMPCHHRTCHITTCCATPPHVVPPNTHDVFTTWHVTTPHVCCVTRRVVSPPPMCVVTHMCVVSPHRMCVVSPHRMCVVSPHRMCVVSPHHMCVVSPHHIMSTHDTTRHATPRHTTHHVVTVTWHVVTVICHVCDMSCCDCDWLHVMLWYVMLLVTFHVVAMLCLWHVMLMTCHVVTVCNVVTWCRRTCHGTPSAKLGQVSSDVCKLQDSVLMMLWPLLISRPPSSRPPVGLIGIK